MRGEGEERTANDARNAAENKIEADAVANGESTDDGDKTGGRVEESGIRGGESEAFN